jgi:acyl carrier protein
LSIDIEAEVLEFVRSKLASGSPAALDVETDLVGGGVLDSTAMMELVVWIEERYRLQVAIDDLVPENFGSARRLAGYVVSRMNGRCESA